MLAARGAVGGQSAGAGRAGAALPLRDARRSSASAPSSPRCGRAPTADELLAAARADLDLGALAQPVTPRFGLAELMLPPAQTRQIDEVVTAMNNLTRVHYEWGTARAWNEGGLAALFAGPPGTGKTMAAEAIAQRADAAAVPHRPVAGRQQVHRRDREEPARGCSTPPTSPT